MHEHNVCFMSVCVACYVYVCAGMYVIRIHVSGECVISVLCMMIHTYVAFTSLLA